MPSAGDPRDDTPIFTLDNLRIDLRDSVSTPRALAIYPPRSPLEFRSCFVHARARLRTVAILTATALVLGLSMVSGGQPALAEDDSSIDILTLPSLESSPQEIAAPELPDGDLPAAEAIAEPVDTGPLVAPRGEDATSAETDITDVSGLDVVAQTENTTTYERGDGSLVRHISKEPINVEVDGEWIDISTSLEGVDGGWEVEAHPLNPQFADEADATDADLHRRQPHSIFSTQRRMFRGAKR